MGSGKAAGSCEARMRSTKMRRPMGTVTLSELEGVGDELSTMVAGVVAPEDVGM